jgi:hypothetical protein
LYQIKCGWDTCETFKLGDNVPWKIWPDRPGEGYLLDGIYDGFGENSQDMVWVVIHEHKVSAIYPFTIAHSDVSKAFGKDILEYSRDWWAEAAWLKRDTEHAKWDLKHAKEAVVLQKRRLDFLRFLATQRLTNKQIVEKRQAFDQQLTYEILAAPIINIMHTESFARQIFKVKPLKMKKVKPSRKRGLFSKQGQLRQTHKRDALKAFNKIINYSKEGQ